MSIIDFVESVCVQPVIYWGTPVDDGYGGKTYDDPVQIYCRWDGSAKLVTDAKGKEFVCVAEVMVTQELDIDGMLYLGTFEDLGPDRDDAPETITGTQIIKQFSRTPLFQSTDEFVMVAYL